MLQQQITRMLLVGLKTHMTAVQSSSNGLTSVPDPTLQYIVQPPDEIDSSTSASSVSSASSASSSSTLLHIIRSRNILWLQSIATDLMQAKDPPAFWNEQLLRICALGHGHGEYLTALSFHQTIVQAEEEHLTTATAAPQVMQWLFEYYVHSIAIESFGESLR